jgi:hypothetical protein
MERSILGWVCVCALVVLPLVGCSDETAAAGGTGGSGDTRGDGGTGGDGGGGQGGVVACVPNELECANAQIDPIEEMCEITVPNQPSACSGTESSENPASCTASMNPVTHQLNRMQLAANCNVGFNLDGCDGQSCSAILADAGIEGADGVDNFLVFWDDFCADKGCIPWDLLPLDQAFHDAICTGGIDIGFEVDANTAENCALVTVLDGGEPVAGGPIPMNLSGEGCLSGRLGTFPLSLRGVQGTIENALVRMTVSSTGFSDGILGGTVNGPTADAILDATIEGLSALAPQSFDINADLSANPAMPCDALSMTLEIGGAAIP